MPASVNSRTLRSVWKMQRGHLHPAESPRGTVTGASLSILREEKEKPRSLEAAELYNLNT